MKYHYGSGWDMETNRETLLSYSNIIPRIFLTEVDSFNSNVGHLESHNNLDLEIMLMLPHKQINYVSYVPTSSGTR